MAGFLQNLVKVAQQRASQVYDQVNPLDGGRTYQQRTPVAPQASAVQQITHNGATNFGGAIAKPLIRSGIALNQGVGNAEVGIAHALGYVPQVKALSAPQYMNQQLGAGLSNKQRTGLNNAVQYTGTKRQLIGDAISNVANVAMPGESKALEGIVKAGAARIAPKVIKDAAPAVAKKLAAQSISRGAVGAVGGAVGNTGSLISSNQPLTAHNLATSAATGAKYGAALGAASPLAVPAAKLAAKGTVEGSKAAYATHLSGKAKLAMNDDLSQQIAVHTSAIKSLKERQAQTPIGSVASENHQTKIDYHQGKVDQLKAQKQKLTIPEKLMNQQVGNTVGGPNALQYMQAKKAGRVFEGVDGKPRFEIDDSGAKMTGVPYGTVGRVLDHPKLYEQYPDIANIPVKRRDLPNDAGGMYDPEKNTLYLSNSNKPKQDKEALFHELQHDIQKQEGFASGGRIATDTPDIQAIKQRAAELRQMGMHEEAASMEQAAQQKAFDNYHSIAGEAEARAVQKRINLKDSQRYVQSEPSYKDLQDQGIHKQPNLSNKQLENLSPEAIDGLKQQGFKGVSNGKRTVNFDNPADTSYRSTHQITSGVPVHKANIDEMVNQIKGKYGLTNYDHADLKKLKAMASNPEADVKIYRASPANELNHGDWVTNNKTYANDIKRQNGGTVHEYTVKAKDLHLPQNIEDNPSLARFSAFQYTKEAPKVAPKSQPATSLRSTFYDSLDVPKDQLIIKHDGGTAMSTATLTLRKQMVKLAKQAGNEKDPIKKDQLYQQVDKLMQTIGNADFEEATRRVGPMMSIEKPKNDIKSPESIVNDIKNGDKVKVGDKVYTYQKGQDMFGDPEEHLVHDNMTEDDLVIKRDGKKVSINTIYQGDKPLHEFPNLGEKATTKPVSSGAAKPPLPPKARGTGEGSSTQLKRSNLTGKALSTPTSKMGSAEYAKAFGVSKEQAAKELTKANETAKTRPIPKQKPKSLTAAENTAKNPTKVTLPKVEEGNYEQARINPQVASHPINYATGQTLDAIKAAGIKDTSTFGKMVEGDLKPRNAKEEAAVQAYKDLSNRVHATSQALGGNTPYVQNYFRHEWDLSNPEKAAQFDKLVTKSKNVNPYAFEGLDRQPRVFTSIKQGEAAGFKLANPDLKDEVANYGSGSAHALKQQALAKALTEADMGEANKPHTFDLGGGKNVLLSDKGMKEAKGYAKSLPTDNKAVQAYRKGNRGFKQMLLSVSQFHPINISALRAAPTLVAEGHPLKGAKGLFDTFAAQADKGYSTKLQTSAMRDGTLEASTRLGTPIKFGSDYSSESKVGFGNGGLGEKAIFERAMPAMHIQMVKAAVQDLKDEGLSLDSKEAHALGTRINEIMGFVNTEARNLDKGTQRRLGDIFLAPQFTRAKWATNKSAVTQGGLAGSYARRSIVANSVASAVVAMGVGYALSQKSDSIGDILMRSVFHPSVPTPLKDKKGNTMELGLPATQSSEVLGLLGFSMKRGSNGHLQVAWKGGNIPGNVANYGRSRLAVLPATGLKIATNTDYAGKPLYDPSADTKTKIEQGATTIGSGLLPIGGQGIVQTNAVKSRLPQGVQQVLDANTPGYNPLLKSVGSAFGLTPKTDKTTGKGLQTTQYFDALDAAKKGLNPNDLAAYNAIHPQSKNPVSGTYQTTPTIYDSQNKATTYLKDPNVLAADNKLNQALKSQGQAIDPFFNLSPDQQNIALNYQALAQGDMRRSNFLKAYPFLNQLSADRNSFFSALPAGNATDTNGNSKAQLPGNLQYPNLTASEQALTDKYYNTTSPTVKKQLLQDPAMAAAVGKVKDYSANIASTRRVPQATDLPGYTPPVPKNPIPSANSGNSTKTTYDPTTQTWTQVSSKTGRTTVISADGTRTVVNAGTRTSTSRKTGTGSRGGKAKLISFPKATSMKSLNSKVASAKVKKLSLSGTIGRSKMRSYKQPTLRLRKKLA